MGPSALYAAAVAIRAGRDPAPFLDRLAADPDVPAELVSFLEVLRTGDPREATDELEGLRVEDRPVAMAAAVIALGERCPPEWRRMATELLSTGQRPYFAR